MTRTVDAEWEESLTPRAVCSSILLKGRSIAENICLINNVISYTHLKDIPGLLLFIDFEKAFDTIKWTFVRKLEHFGFGSSLINWINLFHCDIQSCIINNGWSGGFLA